MIWVGTSWKMHNDIFETKKYIHTLIKNKNFFKKKKLIFL